MNGLSPNDKGIGRPFAGEDKRSQVVRIKMEPSEVSDLDEMARDMQTTRSGVIRKGIELVREWLGHKK